MLKNHTTQGPGQAHPVSPEVENGAPKIVATFRKDLHSPFLAGFIIVLRISSIITLVANKICYSCKKLWQGKPTFACQSWVHTLEENMEKIWVVQFLLELLTIVGLGFTEGAFFITMQCNVLRRSTIADDDFRRLSTIGPTT